MQVIFDPDTNMFFFLFNVLAFAVASVGLIKTVLPLLEKEAVRQGLVAKPFDFNEHQSLGVAFGIGIVLAYPTAIVISEAFYIVSMASILGVYTFGSGMSFGTTRSFLLKAMDQYAPTLKQMLQPLCPFYNVQQRAIVYEPKNEPQNVL